MRKFMLISLSVLYLGIQESAADAETKPRVMVNVGVEKSKAGSYQLSFIVKPIEGMQLTYEAPWKLTLLEAPGIAYQGVSKTIKKNDGNHYVYTKSELDEKIPGYLVSLNRDNTEVKSSKISYTLEAFSCTKDKSRCFKDVVKDNYTLKD